MKLLCWIGLHWYQKKFRMGVNTYYECKFCKDRTYSPAIHGYSPINKKWLNGEE